MNRKPIYRLPPLRVEAIYQALSETIDWGLAAYGIPEAWLQTRGEGIRVAVLDTGMDEEHPDLAGSVRIAEDFTASRLGVADAVGHGTHVAGIIAARQNDQGVVGICPRLSEAGGGLLIGKVLDDGGVGYPEWIAAGIDWAADQQAHIISMSLGSPDSSPLIERAIRRAVDRGIFVICAAGNNGADNSVDYPARYAETLTVGAVDRHGRVAPFSSRGDEVDVAAPGQDVLSTYPGGRYAKLSGTSMATPFVAGVVALMLSKHRQSPGPTPIQTFAQLLEHVRRTARDAGSPGKDPAYGYGLINPSSMLLPIGPGDLPVWAGLRLAADMAGTPADFVLVPRDSRITIDPASARLPSSHPPVSRRDRLLPGANP